MVLARDEIQELIRENRLKIGNFDPQYLEPATYDMRLGNDAFLVSSHTAGTR
ncbi:MAG: dCTP deaminase domain-containing protein, partial [Anaerolineales bacterium]